MTDPAPWQAGRYWDVRYRWLPADDPDLLRLRAEMQEGAPGMYLVWCPIRRRKVVIEAYWPVADGLRNYRMRPEVVVVQGKVEMVGANATPRQMADYQLGRLTAVGEVVLLRESRRPASAGEPLSYGGVKREDGINEAVLDNRLLTVLRRNNRNARAELRRQTSGHDRKLAITNDIERRDERQYQELGNLAYDVGLEIGRGITPHSYGGIRSANTRS